jgi:opacity protein-like surface antigen
MTRTFVRAAALIVAVAVAATPADAQRAKSRARGSLPITWSLGAGLSMPTGDLGDAAGMGFHLQGTSSYRRAGWPVALRGELAYHRFGEKDFSAPGGNPNQTIDFTGKSSSIAGIVDVTYAFVTRNRMKPYVLGGPGFYNTRAELTRTGGTSETTSDTKVGFNLGGGINFAMGRRLAYLEARYHHVDQAAWIPISFGVRF